jgi:hypothetical protein
MSKFADQVENRVRELIGPIDGPTPKLTASERAELNVLYAVHAQLNCCNNHPSPVIRVGWVDALPYCMIDGFPCVASVRGDVFVIPRYLNEVEAAHDAGLLDSVIEDEAEFVGAVTLFLAKRAGMAAEFETADAIASDAF